MLAGRSVDGWKRGVGRAVALASGLENEHWCQPGVVHESSTWMSYVGRVAHASAGTRHWNTGRRCANELGESTDPLSAPALGDDAMATCGTSGAPLHVPDPSQVVAVWQRSDDTQVVPDGSGDHDVWDVVGWHDWQALAGSSEPLVTHDPEISQLLGAMTQLLLVSLQTWHVSKQGVWLPPTQVPFWQLSPLVQ